MFNKTVDVHAVLLDERRQQMGALRFAGIVCVYDAL
jgi:hypothetical protein